VPSPPAVEAWRGENVSVAEIEKQLSRLRGSVAGETELPIQRTSVMTHIAWVPPEWVEAAERTLEGMEESHPSRTIVLVPMGGEESGLDATLSLQCSTTGDQTVSSEVIWLRLRGPMAAAPASLVLPLALSDLPIFLRWRGEPPFGEPHFEQLVDVADRLVVDSSEWDELRYAELSALFAHAAVSDIEWARTYDWRVKLASTWPGIREQEIRVRGPRAAASLLRGWLASRLSRTIRPIEPAGEIGVRLGGEELRPPHEPARTSSQLLSAELDRFGRDRVYEDAVLAAV
jgi:glucose-6-phosphate dehydrogenase assembly protein OpcA